MNKLNLPKISVITPSYNSASSIEKAITNVLQQDYPNFEHIIMDGGSTDGTVEILKKYDHLIWVSEPDKGQSDAMNKGISKAQGDIIVFLNADDFFEPGAFYTAAKYLNKEKDIWFVVGECNVINEKGQNIQGFENPKITLFEMLHWWKYQFPINPSSYFYYKEVHNRVGLFEVENHYTMDYDFLLRAALGYNFHKIPETLGNYLYVPGTKTYESNKTSHWINGLIPYKKYWKHLSLIEQIEIRLSFIKFKLSRTKVYACIINFIQRVLLKIKRIFKGE